MARGKGIARCVAFIRKYQANITTSDGYKSLTVKSEGGEAEEIVSEENGILISMLLRQYFLSLKVLRRWTKLEPSMGRHWNRVQKDLQPHCPLLEANSPESKKQEEASSILSKNAIQSTNARKVRETTEQKQLQQQQERNRHEQAALSLGAKSRTIKDAENCSRCRSEDRSRKQMRNHRQQQHGGDDSAADSESDDDTDLSHVKPVSAAIEQHNRELVIIRRVMRKWRRLSGLKDEPCTCDGLGEGEFTASWTRVSCLSCFVLFQVSSYYICRLTLAPITVEYGDICDC